VIVGRDNKSGAIYVFVQGEDAARYGQDEVRDFLIAQGVDDAIAMDSGGASMLVIDTKVEVSPDFWREKTMPMGMHFTVTP
jgi:hypothetical protein